MQATKKVRLLTREQLDRQNARRREKRLATKALVQPAPKVAKTLKISTPQAIIQPTNNSDFINRMMALTPQQQQLFESFLNKQSDIEKFMKQEEKNQSVKELIKVHKMSKKEEKEIKREMNDDDMEDDILDHLYEDTPQFEKSNDEKVNDEDRPIDEKSSIDGMVKKFTIYSKTSNMRSIELFMTENNSRATEVILKNLKEMKGMKVRLDLVCQYHKKSTDKEGVESVIEVDATMRTKPVTITNTFEATDYFLGKMSEMSDTLQSWEGKGSGHVFNLIKHIVINVDKYSPIKGNSYIDLPAHLKNKGACINIQNKDDQCFKWCILAYLHPIKVNPERVTKYKNYLDELNFDGLEFPISIDKITKFENQNSISVNVFGYEDKQLFH